MSKAPNSKHRKANKSQTPMTGLSFGVWDLGFANSKEGIS